MTYNVATVKVNATLMHEIMKIFIEEVEPIRHLPGFGGAVSMQTMAKDEISHFSRNGGNSLGIRREDGPLIGKSSYLLSHFKSKSRY